MMARKCDLCGELYEHYDGMELFKNEEHSNAITFVNKRREYGGSINETYDLCPLCMRDLLDFVAFLKCRGAKESKKQ